LLLLAAFAGGAAFLGLTHFAVLHADWCPVEQLGRVECLRNWIGALSGWDAAFAAGVTVFVLVGQMAQARRQSDWMVGDAIPTASLFDPRETRIGNAFSNRLNIVNWNRHPIFIRTIRLVAPTGIELLSCEVEDHDPARRNALEAEYARGSMYVPGWVDRSVKPTVAEFNLTFRTNVAAAVAAAQNNLVRARVELALEIVIVGDEHTTVSLAVARPDALMVVDDA